MKSTVGSVISNQALYPIMYLSVKENGRNAQLDVNSDVSSEQHGMGEE